ncbi:hypothetical protein Q3G72_016265 [Acer saccharum]|nr:hypothetical protein Q3G72_016265 [Acer saccharum]
MIDGGVKDQYSKLREYAVEVMRMNLDTIIILKCNDSGRQLLTTIGVDPNNQMYQVAYALVEAETKDTWGWFLEQLAVDLELNNSFGIV